MEEDRALHKELHDQWTRREGKNVIGRPKNCWIQSVRADLKRSNLEAMSFEELRQMAGDRTNWRKLVVYAKRDPNTGLTDTSEATEKTGRYQKSKERS
jgi:hypothetical protein